MEQTYRDLAQDAEELTYLIKDAKSKVEKATAKLTGSRADWSPFTFNYLTEALRQKTDILDRYLNDLDLFERSIIEKADPADLIKHKREIQDLARILIGEAAGLINAANWQAPSYQHTAATQAGLMEGRIKGNLTDYTRDQQIEGNELQRKFGQEYYGVTALALPQVLLTNSGMAALTTIITMMLREKILTRPVLVGRGSYFQNKELLLKLLPVKAIEFDETDPVAFEALAQKWQPAAVFVDSLANNPMVTQPNLEKLDRILKRKCRKKCFLVIDTTCQAFMVQAPTESRKVKVIVWESLNKHYQFGLDLTTGGVIWADNPTTQKLFYARMHAGTILPTLGAAILPTPNRRRLSKRLKRLERNAIELAQGIKGAEVIFPKQGYRGSFLVINHHKPKRLLKAMMAAAKKVRVPLVAGSSFGLNISRIYVVAMKNEYVRPFLRIAVGTETMMEMRRLTEVIKQSLRRSK